MAETTNKKPTKLEQENEQLREQIKKSQDDMAELKAQIQLLMQGYNNANTIVEPKRDRTITFISLTDGELILQGTHIYEFKGQFTSRQFTEKEAMIILNNMPQTLSSGMVYIADADFVKDNDLADSYRSILTDAQLKTLLEQNPNYVIDAYKNCSDAQKSIIIDMIIDKRSRGIEVDGNILVQLGKLCGKDLIDVEPLEDDKK